MYQKSNQLFVTTTTGTPASRATLARWTKVVMAEAGINTDFFIPYSTRAAASSTAAKKTHSLDLVLKMGNWRSECTFFKHYLRKVKYFKRNQKSPDTQDSRLKEFPFTPADGMITQVCHSSKRAIRRSKTISTTPYLELPPANQGYDTCSVTSSLNVLEIPNPLSPTSSIASSTFTEATDTSMCEEEHPDPREPKPDTKVAPPRVKKPKPQPVPHRRKLLPPWLVCPRPPRLKVRHPHTMPSPPPLTETLYPPTVSQTQALPSLPQVGTVQLNQPLPLSATPADQNNTLPVINTIFIAPPFKFAVPPVPSKVSIPRVRKKQKNPAKPAGSTNLPIKPKLPPHPEFNIPLVHCKFEHSDANISAHKRGTEHRLSLPAVFAGVDTFTSEDFHALRTEDKKTKLLVCALTKDKVLITSIPHDSYILFVEKYHTLIRIFGDELDKNREVSAGLIACLKRKELRPHQITNTMLEKCSINHNTLKEMRMISIVIGTHHFLIYTTPIVTNETVCIIYTKHSALILEQGMTRFLALNQKEYNTLVNTPSFTVN